MEERRNGGTEERRNGGTEERRAEGAGDFCLCPVQSSLTLDLIRRLNYRPSLRLQHFTATETSPLKRRLDKILLREATLLCFC